MRCQCKLLSCICKTEPQFGEFDSTGIIPGLGIIKPTDQIIKFASILPPGTPGYQAPEVLLNVLIYIYILAFLCLGFHAYHSVRSI